MWTVPHISAQRRPLQPTTSCSTSVPGECSVLCRRSLLYRQDPPSAEAEGFLGSQPVCSYAGREADMLWCVAPLYCMCLWGAPRTTLMVPLLSSADNSTHSADTSTKFVFGQNMSERVLVSSSGAVMSCLFPLATQHVADMLSPVQSDRTLRCRNERQTSSTH